MKSRTNPCFLLMTFFVSFFLLCSVTVVDQKDLAVKDGYWMLIKEETVYLTRPDLPDYKKEYNDTTTSSYLQIAGNKVTNWIRNEGYTGGFYYCNIDHSVGSEPLLITTYPDSLFLLKNNMLLRINWHITDCSTMPGGPSGCLSSGGWPTKNLFYYCLYEGQFPPTGWPPLRTNSTLQNDIQGDWSLVKVTTLRQTKEWNKDSIAYKLTLHNDSGFIIKADSDLVLVPFDYRIDSLALLFSPNFRTIDSLENIPIDTGSLSSPLISYANCEAGGYGGLSNNLDTLIYVLQCVYQAMIPMTFFQSTYYFIK